MSKWNPKRYFFCYSGYLPSLRHECFSKCFNSILTKPKTALRFFRVLCISSEADKHNGPGGRQLLIFREKFYYQTHMETLILDLEKLCLPINEFLGSNPIL